MSLEALPIQPGNWEHLMQLLAVSLNPDGTLKTPPTGGGVPDGGATGQVLTKFSNTDQATDWEAPTSGPPTGAAAGDLTGTYPNPTLKASGPGAIGPIGDPTHAPAVTLDAKGRVSALTSVPLNNVPGPPTGAATGDLTGTYPAPTLAAAGPGATGPIGDSGHIPVVTIDAKGRVSALTSVATGGGPPTGAASGDLTGSYPGPTLAASGPGATGPVGDTTHTPVVTIDAKGRVAALTSVLISNVPGGVASGDLTGTYPGPTLAAAGPGATGPIGSATTHAVVTIDAKGRVTALSSAAPTLNGIATANPTSADVNVNTNKIVNLATPTAATDAATKAYADSVGGGAAGLSPLFNYLNAR